MMAQDVSKENKPPEQRRRKPVQHDEAPSGVTDHPFEPKGEWWSLCKHCNLAASAHAKTIVPLFHYLSDDVLDDED